MHPKDRNEVTARINQKCNCNGNPDVQIVFVKALFIPYKQFLLTQIFRQYPQTLLTSSKVLRMGIQKTQYQRAYELQADSQDFTVDFLGSNRQFDWIETSLVYDKSDKHLTIYDTTMLSVRQG